MRGTRAVCRIMPGGLLGVLLLAAAEEQGGARMKKLPEPVAKGAMSVEEAIRARRSVRQFRDEPLTEQEIAQLLWAAQGVTDERRGFRAAPSAGATFPLETYLVSSEGIYRYLPERHALEPIKRGDYRRELAEAALGQGCVRQAPVSIVFTAVPKRTTARYGQRGLMYIHMEAGHAAQNVHLQAVALGLGSVPIGAFDPARVEQLLGCAGEETALYIVSIGRPR